VDTSTMPRVEILFQHVENKSCVPFVSEMLLKEFKKFK